MTMIPFDVTLPWWKDLPGCVLSRCGTRTRIDWWIDGIGKWRRNGKRRPSVRNRPYRTFHSFTVICQHEPLRDPEHASAHIRQTQPYDSRNASEDHELDRCRRGT